MPHFLLFTTATIAAIVAAALAAQPLYQLAGLQNLVEFEDFAKRFGMIAIAVTIVVLLKIRGQLCAASFGFTPRTGPGSNRRLVALNLAAGVLMLSVPAGLFLLLDIRVPDLPAPFDWSGFLGFAAVALIGALITALIEESFFRGVLFDGFAKRGRPVAAVLATSVFFALLHFVRIEETSPGAEAPWHHGFDLLLANLGTAWPAQDYLSAGLSLFMAGVFLSLVRLSAGRVAPCIGIHAGWIFAIKMDKKLTDLDADAPLAFLAGNYDRFNGYLTAAWLALVSLWWLARMLKKQDAGTPSLPAH